MICIGINNPIAQGSLGGSLYVMSSAFNATETNGATYTISDDIPMFAFDQTTNQYIQCRLQNDGGLTTNKFKANFLLKSTTDEATNKTATFRIRARVINSGEESDQTWGDWQYVDTDLADASKEYLSTQTAEVTMGGGTLAADSSIEFQIGRYVDGSTPAVTDDLDQLANVVSVKIENNL